MNRDQKAAVIEEITVEIKESEAVFAVDYRGISVMQAPLSPSSPGADGESPAARCAAGPPVRCWNGLVPGPAPSVRASGGRGVLTQAEGSSTVRLRVRFGSTGIPGPMVVEMVTFLTYRPLAAAGLARSTSSRAAA